MGLHISKGYGRSIDLLGRCFSFKGVLLVVTRLCFLLDLFKILHFNDKLYLIRLPQLCDLIPVFFCQLSEAAVIVHELDTEFIDMGDLKLLPKRFPHIFEALEVGALHLLGDRLLTS